MAHLQRASASLRIAGDDLVPADITRLLKKEPTAAYARGDQFHTPLGGVVTRRSGMWQLSAEDTEPEDLDKQVSELLSQTTSDLLVWHELSRRFRVDLFCGWFMGSSNEGVAISPSTMVALGSRRIVLSLDIYGSDTLEAKSRCDAARRR